MNEGLANSIRKDFKESARLYRESRLESLPEEELLILEEWISVLNSKNEKEEIEILSETFFITAAICNGFRPSEYMDSMFTSKSHQLHRLGIELEGKLPLNDKINGASEFIEFNIRLRNWLILDDRSPEFLSCLKDDSEYAFWNGCFLKDSDLENAKQCFYITVKGSPSKRIRIRALQNLAWCCVPLGGFDEAINSYYEIIKLAEISDTRELAFKCLGYITALRDNNIDDLRSENIFAPAAGEFNENDVLRQADGILASKGLSYHPSSPPTYLQQEMAKEEGLDEDTRKVIRLQSGIEVDELPAEVGEELVEAQRLKLFKRSPQKAIVNLYKAVANCLQCYIGIRFIAYGRKLGKVPGNIESLSVYQWVALFTHVNRQDDKHINDRIARLLIAPFRAFVENNLSPNQISGLLSLGQNLDRIQKMRNLYEHEEGSIPKGPPSSGQQKLALEEMHSLVIGQKDSNSIIKQIIRLDISKES